LKEEKKVWAQMNLDFVEGRSRARVLFARSVSADGRMQTLSPDALEVGSPSEELSFFNPNRKVLSGVIPGVELGSIVEYAYEVETYNPEDLRLFFPGFYFQGAEPIAFSQVKVDLPKDAPFQYLTRQVPAGRKSEPVVEVIGARTIYTWALEEVPPYTPEPLMPPERDVVPFMEGTVFGSFEEVFGFQNALQQARIRLTPEIEAKTNELTRDSGSVSEKLARLYHWIQENIRYISIKGSLSSGLSGHTAGETFENRYGDCTDKAILFSTMCQVIGVESYPVILMTNDSGVGIAEIPTLDGNHCISEVVLDGQSFYVDTTAETYRYPYFRADDHGAIAVNAIRGDFKTIPVPKPADNRRHSCLAVVLNAQGDVSVKTHNTYTGTIEAGIRQFWRNVPEANRAARMAEYVNSISPGGRLAKFSLEHLDRLETPLSMTLEYVLPGHAVRARDLIYLRMPTLERDYPEVALETRRFPIHYMTTEERVLEIELALPRGYRPKWVPPPLVYSSPSLEYRAAYEVQGRTVRYREEFRRLQRVIPVEDYVPYRDALRGLAAFSQQEIFLNKEG
jgi:hypothetical protein